MIIFDFDEIADMEKNFSGFKEDIKNSVSNAISE